MILVYRVLTHNFSLKNECITNMRFRFFNMVHTFELGTEPLKMHTQNHNKNTTMHCNIKY